MKTGRLFDHITISTLTTSESGGDVTESWSTGTTVRASVKQIDGTRYLSQEELVDREVYEIETWDKALGSNIRITYGSLMLYPIRPPVVNADHSSRGVVKIIAATKV